ncbi:cobalamin-independent methionine synthase catalytic subunit [Nocardioides albertanoniae]|uniref:Cobalamin-independent methionine synthase catalytic subunit n=1 Tax=Nocardioides albertanoniae TaxID=1175486 RepID=A0A543AAB7_9ACTN|nr:methionine synthase [Nocardioides albertanoniae]TQL69544.1 cobalamin-independent methionine synthase catalytic subunit [Nocardioides albertanoniae]
MRATGVGSLPGENYPEAVRVVLGELADLPYLPELPARGAIANMTGRALAVLDGLDADLQPAGWRLTGTGGSPGVDHRRARSLLAQDLDTLEELAQDSALVAGGGAFKVQVTGPWTLAATVERPRGDKLLADHGARRELAQALAEGVRTHIRDVRRRLPGAQDVIVQVDEPALPAVLNAQVPTASGFGKHRSIDLPEASQGLEWVLGAIADEGATPWVHSCAPGTPLGLLRTAGAQGLSVDLAQLSAADHDELASSLEAGDTVALGVVPALAPDSAPTDKTVTETVERWLDMLGLDASHDIVLTPACGLAGADWQWARTVSRILGESARHLA